MLQYLKEKIEEIDKQFLKTNKNLDVHLYSVEVQNFIENLVKIFFSYN